MVLYNGYCRSLNEKVDFNVEDVISMNTTRGIKWRVKGNYEGYNISTFCSEVVAQELLSQLPLTMDAEIAYIPPSETYQSEELIPSFSTATHEAEGGFPCLECGKTYSIAEYDENKDGWTQIWEENQLFNICPLCSLKVANSEDNETEEASLHPHEQIQENTNAHELDLHSEKLPSKYYKKDGSLDMRYKICKEYAAKQAESQNAVELEAPYTPIKPERPSDDYSGGGRHRKKPRRPLGAESEDEPVFGDWQEGVVMFADGSLVVKVVSFPAPDSDEFEGESMWVIVKKGNEYQGKGYLANQPHHSSLKYGTLIEYGEGTNTQKPVFKGFDETDIITEEQMLDPEFKGILRTTPDEYFDNEMQLFGDEDEELLESLNEMSRLYSIDDELWNEKMKGFEAESFKADGIDALRTRMKILKDELYERKKDLQDKHDSDIAKYGKALGDKKLRDRIKATEKKILKIQAKIDAKFKLSDRDNSVLKRVRGNDSTGNTASESTYRFDHRYSGSATQRRMARRKAEESFSADFAGMKYELLVDETGNGLEEAEIVATYPTFEEAKNASQKLHSPTWIAETRFVGDTDEVIESTIIYGAESFDAEDDMIICEGCNMERYSDVDFTIDNAREDVLDDGNALCDYCWASHDKYVENAESFEAGITIGSLPISDNVDEYSTHLCKHCGDGIYYHLQGGDIGNQPARMSWCGDNQEGPECCDAEYHEPYEGEADGINATYKTSIREEPNLVFFERAVKDGNETNGGTVKLKDATEEMYNNWERLYLSSEGLYVGYQPEMEVESFDAEKTNIMWEGDDSLKYSYGGFQSEEVSQEANEVVYAEGVPALQDAEAGIEAQYIQKKDEFMNVIVDDGTLYKLMPDLPAIVEISPSPLAGYNNLRFNFVENPDMEQKILSYAYTIKDNSEEEDKEPEYRAGDVRNRLFNVEFDDWAEQEMLTHGGDVSFKEWADEESDSHGDEEFIEWADHEEESHDERYGAEDFTMQEDARYELGDNIVALSTTLKRLMHQDNTGNWDWQNVKKIGKGIKQGDFDRIKGHMDDIEIKTRRVLWDEYHDGLLQLFSNKQLHALAIPWVTDGYGAEENPFSSAWGKDEAYWQNLFGLQMQDWLEFAWDNKDNPEFKTYQGERFVTKVGGKSYIGSPKGVQRANKPTGTQMQNVINTNDLYKSWKEQSPVIQATPRKLCLVSYDEAIPEMHIFLDYMKDNKGMIKKMEKSLQQLEEDGFEIIFKDAEITEENLEELENKFHNTIASYTKGYKHTKCSSCEAENKIDSLEDEDGKILHYYYSCKCGHNDIQDSPYSQELSLNAEEKICKDCGETYEDCDFFKEPSCERLEGVELSHNEKATRIIENIQQNLKTPDAVKYYYEIFYGYPPAEDYEGDMALEVIEGVSQNLNGKEFVDYMYGEMYGAESFEAECKHENWERGETIEPHYIYENGELVDEVNLYWVECNECGAIGNEFVEGGEPTRIKWDAESFANYQLLAEEAGGVFLIENNKGFNIEFENGYQVSVKFGAGHYSDNYEKSPIIEMGRYLQSSTAEVAILRNGFLIPLDEEGNTKIKGWLPTSIIPPLLTAASEGDEEKIRSIIKEYEKSQQRAEEELEKDSCCCGATVENPCLCMKEGVMNCSAVEPKCPCYAAKDVESFEAERKLCNNCHKQRLTASATYRGKTICATCDRLIGEKKAKSFEATSASVNEEMILDYLENSHRTIRKYNGPYKYTLNGLQEHFGVARSTISNIIRPMKSEGLIKEVKRRLEDSPTDYGRDKPVSIYYLGNKEIRAAESDVFPTNEEILEYLKNSHRTIVKYHAPYKYSTNGIAREFDVSKSWMRNKLRELRLAGLIDSVSRRTEDAPKEENRKSKKDIFKLADKNIKHDKWVAEEIGEFIGRLPKNLTMGEKFNIKKNNLRIIFEEAQRPLHTYEVVELYEQKKRTPERIKKSARRINHTKRGISTRAISRIVKSQPDIFYISRSGLIHYIGGGSMKEYIRDLDPKYFAEEVKNKPPSEEDIMDYLQYSHNFITKYSAPFKYSSWGMIQKYGVTPISMRSKLRQMERKGLLNSVARNCDDRPDAKTLDVAGYGPLNRRLKIYYHKDAGLINFK